MAASVTDMAAEESSSDEEELQRCQEAVWDCQPAKIKNSGHKESFSNRLVVAQHEHDGNELQVTKGFQTHVAKKLGAMLDSLISEKVSSIQPSTDTEPTDNKTDEDEGFRLFSSSIPGQKPEEPTLPKRPIPISSDSDSEKESRLREAAVSISDLFPPSAIPSTFSAAPEMSKKVGEKVKKKKKKKRKVDPEETEQQDSKPTKDNQSNDINQDENQAVIRKKKKKKKKTTSGNSEVLR